MGSIWSKVSASERTGSPLVVSRFAALVNIRRLGFPPSATEPARLELRTGSGRPLWNVGVGCGGGKGVSRAMAVVVDLVELCGEACGVVVTKRTRNGKGMGGKQRV